jgi:glycosyltransferase involved in cell wall biosynthesis
VDISVAVPVHNEEESLRDFCRELDEVMAGLGRSYEILLVDDGSTDGSWELMKELAGQYRQLRLIRFRRNFGQTAAMSAGFREAGGDIIITLDADLQNDPADIPRLLAKMAEGYDVVSGWRKDRKDRFFSRRLPSIIANALISKMTGVYLHDYGCTLKAYRREVMKNVHLYGDMHRFIPALAHWVGGRVSEVVVNHRARQFGRSKYGMSRTTKVVLDLMTVKFLLQYSKGPIQMFGKIGLAFAAPGVLWLLVLVVGNILYWMHCGFADIFVKMAKAPFWTITPFMLIVFGVQFISMGLLAEIVVRTYHESQDKPIYVIKETVEPGDK